MKVFAEAFRQSLPVLGAYWFLGITYGLLAVEMGYSLWIPVAMALAIYSGSVEFIALTLLLGTFQPVASFVMAFVVGARHLFYGITMLDRYRGAGWRKPLLIFWLTDETFALNYSATDTETDKGRRYSRFLWVSLLDCLYWVSGTAIGFLLGHWTGDALLQHLQGLDFVVTAMFTAIFMDDYMRHKTTRLSAWLGIACSLLCLAAFGPDRFILPTMTAMLTALYLLYRHQQKKDDNSI